MRNREIVQTLRRELGAVLKLTPWLLIVFLLTAVIWRTDLAATGGMFQSSPAEPTVTPEPTQPIPTPTYTPPPDATPTITPTATTFITATATVTVAPSVTATVTNTSTPAPTPTLMPTPITPSPTPTSNTVESGAESDTRYPEGESNLNFEWGMLFDSVALGMTYLWMCCGALILFAVPAGFVILWVASKRYRQSEEFEDPAPGQPGESVETQSPEQPEP